MKITILGCGKMGGCLARRLSSSHAITLYDQHKQRAEALAKEISGTAVATAQAALNKADIVILAVKPQDLEAIAKLIHRELYAEQLLVSILAGVLTEELEEVFTEIPILRMMPNLAVEHGTGVVGFAENENLSVKLQERAKEAFASLGSLHWIPETQFDALTAITGSGPAFLCVLIESIIESGILMGIGAEKSKELTLQLFQSTLSMLEHSNKHPGELKWDVTSPKGVTIAGLAAMEEYGVRAAVQKGFIAAYQRSKELSFDH